MSRKDAEQQRGFDPDTAPADRAKGRSLLFTTCGVRSHSPFMRRPKTTTKSPAWVKTCSTCLSGRKGFDVLTVTTKKKRSKTGFITEKGKPSGHTALMPKPRKRLVSLSDTPYYHCISRCLRRAFLCGIDPLTGFDFSHRRARMVERMQTMSILRAHFLRLIERISDLPRSGCRLLWLPCTCTVMVQIK